MAEEQEKAVILDMAELRIKKYLDEMSERDQSFKEKYKSDNQSIRNCRIYIESEVRKTMRTMFTDDEIFNMAVHFFVEGLEAKGTKSANIVHSGDYSKDDIEAEIGKLDETKKEKLKAVAEREFVEQQKKKLSANAPKAEPKQKAEPKPKKEPKPKVKKESEPMMLDLFAGLD